MFKKNPQIARTDSLKCIPVKNSLVKEEQSESGDLILSYPSMYKPFFSKIQRMLQSNPKKTFQRKIELDGLGMDVWTFIDGKKNVKTIITHFAQKHVLNEKEAEISVSLFLKSLGEKGLIVINEPGEKNS